MSALETSSDGVFVLSPDSTIVWANAASGHLLAMESAALIGRSLAEFLHPDDLQRAAEVMTLTGAGVFEALPITPALYRVRAATGEWVSLEVNASLPEADGNLLAIARIGGDLVLTDQLLEAVTGGMAFAGQVGLVLEMGRWRHPNEGYAIIYGNQGTGRRSVASDGLPPVLAGSAPVDGPTPWQAVLGAAEDLLVPDLNDLRPDDDRMGWTVARAARAAGFTGCLAAAVRDPGHDTDACILIWTTERGPTTSGHGYSMANMRRALALVLQQRAQVLLLEQAARVDDLTGLTSRAWFFNQLATVERTTERTACHTALYIDLDGFKAVNDTFGHTVGDHVLAIAARRLAAVTPPGALVARLGGDEFAVLCGSGVDRVDAAVLAQQIIDSIAAPIPLPKSLAETMGRDDEPSAEWFTIGASVGLAVGEAGQDPQAVLDAADAALLEAKAAGRGRWHTR